MRRRRTFVLTWVLAWPLLGLTACDGTSETDEADPPAPTSSASPTSPTSASPTVPEATASAAPGPDLSGAPRALLPRGVRVPREVVPVGAGRLLVADQAGRVMVLEDGALRATPFLDVRRQVLAPTAVDLELGLAGFALAPDFDRTGHVYTFTTQKPRPDDSDSVARVDTLTRWTASPESLRVDPASAEVLMAAPRTFLDHVGGEIVFDDRGLLYTSFGAQSSDPAAQDPATLDGTVIRIDPRRATARAPYSIPAGNPFADGGGRPEIWSLGYRNPWRLAWDDDLGLVVGSALFTHKPQQVNLAKAGDNAGYPEVHDPCWVDGALTDTCRNTEAGAPIASPAMEYDSSVGVILSGVAPVDGQVFVSDWKGAVLSGDPGAPPWPVGTVTLPAGLDLVGRFVWDLDVARDGSLYLLTTSSTMDDGQVWQLAAP